MNDSGVLDRLVIVMGVIDVLGNQPTSAGVSLDFVGLIYEGELPPMIDPDWAADPNWAAQ